LWLLIKNDDGHIVNSSEFQDSLGEWITAFECDPECGKVIHAVFKESKIESTICAGLVSACLNWIEKRIHCESSRLPLQECISRFINDHSGNQKVRDRILHVATHWLSINVHAEELRYVMPLAFDFAKKWSDTDTNIWSTLWEYSASWLKLYKTSAEAGYVIEKCLLVPIFSKDRGADVLTILAFWITFNWPERYALKQFRYACGNAPEEMSVEFVERLLPFFVEKKQADKIDQFFINQYCSNYRNRKVPEKSFVQLIGAAKQWLNKYRRSKYACFVIGPILWRSELSVGDRDYFKREAEEWVSLYGEDDVAHIVSEPYSQFKELD